MAPTSCFSGQVHRLPDAPQAYGAMITRPKAAPAQSRYADLVQQPVWNMHDLIFAARQPFLDDTTLLT